jgi:hypothetical protein
MLPELLLVEDVARVLGVCPATARRAIRRGDVGRFLRVGRRLAVRRPEFLAALDARQETPTAPVRVLRPVVDRTTPCGRCGRRLQPDEMPGGSTHDRELLCGPCAARLDEERGP